MPNTRRQFLAHLASASALAAVGIAVHPNILSALDRYPHAGDPILKDLAAKALDAARSAGASYADVRFTLTRTESITARVPGSWYMYPTTDHGAVGVRALVDGAWGFAASNAWTLDEAARLGREASVQAKMNAHGRRRRIELGDPPPAVTGTWSTPVKADPFTVPLAEKLDVMWALAEVTSRLDVSAKVSSSIFARHRRQEKTFASTDGCFLTQTLFHSDPQFTVAASRDGRYANLQYDRLQPTAGGWEVLTDASLVRDIPPLVEEVVRMLESEPLDPDRYDVVFDGYTTARILALTVGLAAELDRALGYEANAGGTSYLAPPDEVLGKFALGPRHLNVVADRSRQGALATVKWDDEGIAPEAYTVIKDGVLVDYHTTRELAQSFGAASSVSARRPIGSHGCAASANALGITLSQTPNLAMLPGAADTSLQDLVESLDRGLVVVGGRVTMDRQQLNGEVNAGMVYEVRKGKRTRFVHDTELLFRAPELWKGLQAIGGSRSQVWTGVSAVKGEPYQEYSFSVGAVPARFTQVVVTDRSRRA